MRNWLVVANAAKARVLEASERGEGWETVAGLVHPASRQKGSELAFDRAGHVPGAGRSGTGGSSAFDHRTDPREREHDRFAREVAEMLNAGVASGRCAGLVLVASNPFLGHLKQHLDTQASRRVLRTLAADLTALDERALAARLQADTEADLNG